MRIKRLAAIRLCRRSMASAMAARLRDATNTATDTASAREVLVTLDLKQTRRSRARPIIQRRQSPRHESVNKRAGVCCCAPWPRDKRYMSFPGRASVRTAWAPSPGRGRSAESAPSRARGWSWPRRGRGCGDKRKDEARVTLTEECRKNFALSQKPESVLSLSYQRQRCTACRKHGSPTQSRSRSPP